MEATLAAHQSSPETARKPPMPVLSAAKDRFTPSVGTGQVPSDATTSGLLSM